MALMLSNIQQSHQMCRGDRRCQNRGQTPEGWYQAVTVQAAALLQDAGSDQLLWSVLSHYALSKPRYDICSAAKAKEVEMKHFEQWVRLPLCNSKALSASREML